MGNVTAKTSGEIASFMTPAETNIKSLKVHFSPKQLGEGDPSPENVREIEGWDGVEINGCGRNLLQNANGSLSYLHLKKGTTITISQSMDSNVGYFRGYDINKTTNTPLVWINQKNNGKRIWSEYTLEDDIYYAVCYTGTGMKEAQITIDGSVDFEPYQGDNISYQWKIPDEYQEVEYIEKTDYNQYIDTGILGNGELQFKCKLNITQIKNGSPFFGSYGNSQRCYFLIQNNNNIGYSYITSEYSSTTLETNKDYNINVIFKVGEQQLYIDNNIVLTTTKTGTIKTEKNIFLFGYNFDGRFDADRSSFIKLYNAILYKDNVLVRNFIPCYRKSDNEIGMYDTVSQTFYTNQGTGTFLKGEDVNKTFYGGYVDLISGELVETNVAETFTSTLTDNTSYDAEDSIYFGLTSSYPFVSIYSSGAIVSESGVSTAPRDGLCNRLKIDYIDNWRGTQYINSLCSQYLLGGFSVRMSKDIFNLEDGYTGQEKQNAINEYLSANPIIVYYELKTPITHQLTPTQLQSFIGQNNFWSNADYIEIEYELKETEDIQKARKKIILNQPHIESINGDIANFTTNMKAPLKECKVYFNPVQEGSGDPSPDNVRNITGWEGVNVGLPDEYQEVEYIESTGTQAIYTDIPAQLPIITSCDLMFTGSQDSYFFGTRGNDVRICTCGYYSNQWQWALGTYRLTRGISANVRYKMDAILKNGSQVLTLNDSILSESSYTINKETSGEGFSNFALFAYYNEDSKSFGLFTKARCYSARIWNGENKILGNFIPCYRKSDGEIGMYDTVSKTFYTNSGTGTFLKGDDVNTIIGNISWSDEIGTVYGGYVDLVKGELVGNWIKRDLSEMSTINAPNTSLDEPWNHRFLIENWDYNNSGWEKVNGRKNFIIDNITNDENGKTNFTAVGIDNSPIVYIYDNTISTVEEFKTKYSEHYICYEIKFPIRYSLTPQQLLTFKGENNIWSDTNGQTEVKFWTH